MKLLVLALLGTAYARPDISGSYLPGITGGSTVLSPSIGIIPGIGGNAGDYIAHQEQRHVFFYAAPDDEPPARFKVYVSPSSHRNTKVIFVKAPTYAGVIPEVIAPPSQTEDRTVVYVLVKKQQHGGSVTIPSSLGIKQAKPEVHFVKYRNQQDAEQAVLAGLNGQSYGSKLSDLGSETAFVRHIGISGPGSVIAYGAGSGTGTGPGTLVTNISSGSSGLGIADGPGFVTSGTVDTGISSGSSILGTAIDGTPGGVHKGVVGTVRYGTPGDSGPYKR